MTRHVRQRFLLHTGTAPEVAMDLQDYGIATKHLPQNMGGEYTQQHFLQWMEQRRVIELAREQELFGLDDDDDDEADDQNSFGLDCEFEGEDEQTSFPHKEPASA
jgi:hypothetical protein